MYDITKLKNNQDNKQVAKALNTIYNLESVSDLNGVEQAFKTSAVMQESGELAKSYLLYFVKSNNLTKDKFKNIESYAQKTFGIGKSACYNYCKVGKYINPKTALDYLPQPIFTNYTDIDGNIIEYQAKRPNYLYSELLALVENLEEKQIEEFSEKLRINKHLKAVQFRKLVKTIKELFKTISDYYIPELTESIIAEYIELKTDSINDNTNENANENANESDNELIEEYIKESILYKDLVNVITIYLCNNSQLTTQPYDLKQILRDIAKSLKTE